MGQRIEVGANVVGDVVLLETDRSITGQDGAVFESAAAAANDDRFPAALAARIFESDDAVDHVFVGSNVVVVRRLSGWDDDAVASVSTVVSGFFLFYPEAG
ncbi:MAG: hypothetical protein ACE5GC_02500 [Acidimicrobiia bacterium]